MLLASIIKKVAPPPAIESFDHFLFLGPHPDDIEIGAGATIAKLAGKGKKITFLICTDGRLSVGRSQKEDRADDRRSTAGSDLRSGSLCRQ